MIKWPDPSRPVAPPTRMDMIAKGADCARHPLLGCIIAHGSATPEEQARNYLISLYRATEQGIAGREHDLTLDEYRQKLHELEQWEARGNFVQMPPPIVDHPFQVPPPGPQPASSAAEPGRAAAAPTVRGEAEAARAMRDRLAHAVGAMVERGNNSTH